MGKRKTAGDFNAFLGALRRTGNMRVAALQAGMDVGTAYDKAIKDPKFAARLEAARATGKAAAAKARARARAGNGALVARTTKRGTQLIRVGPGRWSQAAQERFRAALAHTGCVREAARASGFSTTTVYERRKHYSDFAEDWAAAEAVAVERLPGLLVAAGIAALDPEIDGKAAKLPPVNVDQAIRIVRMKGTGGAGGGRPGRNIPPEPSIAAVRANILRKLDAIEAHEKNKGGGDGPPPPSPGPEAGEDDD